MSEMKDAFQAYAVENLWRDTERKSGPGSTIAFTINIRAQLAVLVRSFRIKTFFDAPCGDFNWMRAVDFPDDMFYIGGEIAPKLVEENCAAYAQRNRSFIEFDITSTTFPQADIWFCRDCLFHLPNNYILLALRNFYSSGIRWMMTSTHLNNEGFKNSDIPMAGFRLIDLYSEPFFFPREVQFKAADYVFPYYQREMALWTRDQVALAISRMQPWIDAS